MHLLHLACVALLAGWSSAAVCTPLVECRELLESEPTANPFAASQLCKLKDGSDGVMCGSDSALGNRFGGAAAAAPQSGSGGGILFPGQTSESKNVFDVQPLKNRFKSQQELIIKSSVQTNQVVLEAQRKLAQADRKASELSRAGTNLAGARSPEQLQLLFSRPQSEETQLAARASLQSVQVLTDLKKALAVGSKPFESEGQLLGVGLQDRAQFPALRGTDKIPGCVVPPPPDCANAMRYRTASGECNSLSEPRLGRAQTAFSRFFPAEYEDGIFEPRTVGLAGPLPSARLVSERVVDTTPGDDLFRSVSVMQFGQFINHDMISTAAFTAEGGGGLTCCNRDNTFPAEPLHPTGCLPIRVHDDDPFYARFGRTCMSQVRSLPAPFERCVAGPASQLNQVSQYLDGSNVYGSDDQRAGALRALAGGRIKTSEGDLLPLSGGSFFSGEGRLSENPGLAFMHTIWTREHNRVADALSAGHPDWSDEQLYQEARRVTVGEYQNIVYNEYVPTVLGFRYTREHGLDPEFGHSFSYSDNADPRITSEFSTAAFRFGHSQVHDAWLLRSETGRLVKALAMEDSFFQADLLRQPGAMAQLARSMTRQKPRAVDNTFSQSLHEKLFAQGAPSGLDLVALNINRGRDHGLPTYLTALENCLERTIGGEWDGLAPFFEPQVLLALRSVYDSVFDIDLFIGGVAEKRKPGALVGEVFQCIIGEQFFGIRYGDRFFYDNGDLPNSMSFRQVREIQQSNWARVLCDNIEGLEAVQPLAFWQPSVFFNSLRSCQSFAIPTVDLSVF